MKTIELLNKAVDPLQVHRDLVIDELNDLITDKSISNSDQEIIVDELLKSLSKETDSSVLESLFNFLGNAFENYIRREDIVSFSISLIDQLSPGCLIHAIPIIWESGHKNRRDIVEHYISSNNAAVRNAALEAIQSE